MIKSHGLYLENDKQQKKQKIKNKNSSEKSLQAQS